MSSNLTKVKSGAIGHGDGGSFICYLFYIIDFTTIIRRYAMLMTPCLLRGKSLYGRFSIYSRIPRQHCEGSVRLDHLF